MIDLDELMRLHAAATPGPWEVKLGDFVDDEEVITLHPYIEVNRQAICVPFERGPDDDNEEADIAFICAACNAVPELIAELKEARAENADLRNQLREALERC